MQLVPEPAHVMVRVFIPLSKTKNQQPTLLVPPNILVHQLTVLVCKRLQTQGIEGLDGFQMSLEDKPGEAGPPLQDDELLSAYRLQPTVRTGLGSLPWPRFAFAPSLAVSFV